MTAGLRWEAARGLFRQRRKQPGHGFAAQCRSFSSGNVSSITNPVTGASVPLTGRLAFVASPQYTSCREEQLHWLLFSPRFGIAYRLTPQTVVRTGYGLSYLPAEFTADGAWEQPDQLSRSTSINNTVGQPLLTTVANPLPNGINLPSGRTQAGLNASLGGLGIGGRIPKPGLWVRSANGIPCQSSRRSTAKANCYRCLRRRKGDAPCALWRLHWNRVKP